MPWCPKCKCEYEEDVQLCADCKVELVEKLEDFVLWKVLVKARKEEDAREVVEYLEYSGIEKIKYEVIQNEEEESLFAISASEKEVDIAMKYLKGYMMNKAIENQDEEEDEEEEEDIVNEYETEEYNDDTLVKDLKSSAYTFGFVGVGMLVVSVLVFLEIITIGFTNRYLFSGLMFVMSIAFIIIAINSATRINKEAENITNRDSSINKIVEWFGSNYELEHFANKFDLDIDGLDEGAIYYMVMDKLKEVISKEFVDMDMKIVNSAAEIIYEKIMSER